MTTATLQEPSPWAERRRRLYLASVAVLAAGATALRTTARPVRAHLLQHGYSICGLGCIAGAAFVHSVFSGLLVLGLLILVFEWKVSD